MKFIHYIQEKCGFCQNIVLEYRQILCKGLIVIPFIIIYNCLFTKNVLNKCSRRIRKRRELVKHLKKRTRMKCPKCEKSFQKYENFEAHMRIHFGKKVLHSLTKNFRKIIQN